MDLRFFGFLLFLMIAGMAFWLLIFLANFIPYWIIGAIKERFFPKKEEKKQLQDK